MSQGQWEGCPKSEIYTPEMVNLMESSQPDFSAPSGESLRQVQFRMMEFLNRTILRLPEKIAMGDTLSQQNEPKGFSRQSSSNSVQDGPPWDLLYRLNRHSLHCNFQPCDPHSLSDFRSTGLQSYDVTENMYRRFLGYSSWAFIKNRVANKKA